MQIFTLASGDYVYGAAALCNSLCASGFKGQIHIGHIGPLDWCLSPNAPVILHELTDVTLWLGNYKPALMLRHGSGIAAYIDADCIVKNESLLKMIADVVSDQPIFCAEGIIPREDIRRLLWSRHKKKCLPTAEREQQRLTPPRDTYFNSGFLCINVDRDRWILEGWKKLIDAILVGRGHILETPYFPMPDQDCLNAFLQDNDLRFTCLTPPDVWFAASALNPFMHIGLLEHSLLHCTGYSKPWTLEKVPARLPNVYETQWYHYAFENTPWIKCKPQLSYAVLNWLRGGLVGRAVQYFRRVTRMT